MARKNKQSKESQLRVKLPKALIWRGVFELASAEKGLKIDDLKPIFRIRGMGKINAGDLPPWDWDRR